MADYQTATSSQRELAARLIQNQRTSIMSRIHLILGDNARKIADTDDIFSTSLRRVDHAVNSGNLEAMNERQFYAFVHAVIKNTILEKSRNSVRISERERHAQSMFLSRLMEGDRKSNSNSVDLELIGKSITDPIDREIVLLKGRGLSFPVIAETTGMEQAAVRKRWSRIRARVRAKIKEDQGQ